MEIDIVGLENLFTHLKYFNQTISLLLNYGNVYTIFIFDTLHTLFKLRVENGWMIGEK